VKAQHSINIQAIEKLKDLEVEELARELIDKRHEKTIYETFGRLPAESVQLQFTGLSLRQTFIQGLTYLKLCKKIADRQNRSFERQGSSSVVDFGSGWGRITQLLSLYFDPNRILGCDVMDTAIDEAKRNGVRAEFISTEPWPPTRMQNETVDYIFSYSVFSHLSEDNARAWIREFHRILRPGGLVFITTRHREFFDYLETLREKTDIPSFANGAHKAFKDIESAKKNYDQGFFCFDPLGGGGKGLTPVYGEAFIPESYVHEKYGKIFSAVGYEDPIPQGLLDQATIWLQK
jgi:2-polyprenyl-3-methyl-5-hydroxy-6-metoxy-1,4-benzoquinol methylase